MTAAKKCNRTVCLASVDQRDPATHVVSLEEYCNGCMRRINSVCRDVYPDGVILPRSAVTCMT